MRWLQPGYEPRYCTECENARIRNYSGSPPTSGNLAIALPGSHDERHHVDRFRHRTLSNINGGFSSFFWDKLILQMSVRDPAVRHAIVALASIHEENDSTSSPSPELRRYCTNQYVRSLGHLQNHIANGNDNKTEVVLTCCVIFTAFENFQGKPASAMVHLQNGLRILSQSGSSSVPALREGVFDDLILVFVRLNIQARSVLRPALPECHQLHNQNISDIPVAFATLTKARDALSNMFSMGFSMFQSMTSTSNLKGAGETESSLAGDSPWTLTDNPTSSKLTTDVFRRADKSDISVQLSEAESLMAEWFAAFKALLSTRLSSKTQQLSGLDLRCATLLQIHYICAMIVIRTSTDMSDLSFDSCVPSFHELVHLSSDLIGLAGWDKQPSFSIDLGVVAPLYFTVTSCRHPHIKRRANKLLKSMQRREGQWDSAVAAQVGEWCVNIEEGRLSPKSTLKIMETSVAVENSEDSMARIGNVSWERNPREEYRRTGFGVQGFVCNGDEEAATPKDWSTTSSSQNRDLGIIRRVRRLEAEVQIGEKSVRLKPIF